MNGLFKKVIFLNLILFLFFSVMTATTLAAASTTDIVDLQILTINDFHGALIENGKNPGAAKIATYLKTTKMDYPDTTLILSAGDMFQGSPDSNLLYGKTVVAVMNAIGFDAMTLGNHEFDWGTTVLKERIAEARFPYISANVFEKITGKLVDFVKPYVFFERNGVKIAVIGLTTPETAYKSSAKVVSAYRFNDPTAIVNGLVPELKQQGADIIIVLSHMGSVMNSATGEITGEAADLALHTQTVDAIISGHTHQIVHGTVNNIPIVQANCWGRAVGKIAIAFNKNTKQVISSSATTITLSPSELIPDLQVKTIVDQAQTEIAPIKNIILGRAVVDLDHDRDAQQLSLLGQWTTDVMREATHSDIAFQNAGGIRTSIAAGNITIGNLYEVFPFDNTLFTVDMTGAQIMDVLQHGIMNHNIGMVQFSGIQVAYNKDQPDDQRITVTLNNGNPLELTKSYKVVTNDFMAGGGDNFTMFKNASNPVDTNIPLRDLIVTTIKKLKRIEFKGDHRFIESKSISANFLSIAA